VYHPNYACTPPENENVRVWRYMTFIKFMSLLDRSALYFARVDRLGDPFEGSYGRRNLTGDLLPEEMIPVFKSMVPGSKSVGLHTSTPAERRSSFVFAQRTTYANCWHMNDHESAAMWSVYSRSGEGIAIQSTYQRLRDCFNSPDHNQSVTIGVVKYIDYEVDAVPETSSLFRYLYKRKSFEHEHELRALSIGSIPKPVEGRGINSLTVPTEPGKYIDISLPTLIESVHVSPKSPDWVTDLVRSTVVQMAMRYEFDRGVPVINSRLDDQPLY
jgi:hypothetical protein